MEIMKRRIKAHGRDQWRTKISSGGKKAIRGRQKIVSTFFFLFFFFLDAKQTLNRVASFSSHLYQRIIIF